MMESDRGTSERTLLLLLACVQFTHIMDFMVMMPLGPQLMRELNISAASFGHIISAFAITAGVVGLAMAPYADRFDRKKVLIASDLVGVAVYVAMAPVQDAGWLLLFGFLAAAAEAVDQPLAERRRLLRHRPRQLVRVMVPGDGQQVRRHPVRRIVDP